jgi:transcription initiation factor TFIIB
MTLQIYEKYHKKTLPRDDPKDCLHPNLITDSIVGDVFCAKCGQVVSERIEDSRQEYTNSFEDYNNMGRTGLPTSLSLHDKGLSTFIDKKNYDFVGKKIRNNTIYDFNRLRLWDSRTKFRTAERNLSKALFILEGAKNKLALPDPVSERGAYLYRKAASEKLIRGRSIRNIIGASIYIACRQENVPRSLLDIAKTINITKGELARAYRVIVNNLDLKIPAYNPIEFLAKICNNIRVSEKTKRYALSLLKQAEEKELFAGRNPMVICTAAAYLACLKNGEPKSQEMMSEVSGITDVALRNNVSFLIRQLKVDCSVFSQDFRMPN